jgi:DNA-binding beta-propeller fold protein YncE
LTRQRVYLVARPLMHLMIVIAASGCAQGSPVSLTQSYFGALQTLAGPATQHFYGMYSSQPSGNEVIVYKRKRNGFTLTPYETLTSGFSAPMGMVTTPDGWWYIANSGDSNVLVYRTTRSGPNGPKATLRDDGEVPVNVAVTPSRQIVAVSNASTTGSGAGSLSIYLNQRHKPSRTLTYGIDPIRGEGIAIDSNGNCYWSFNDPRTLSGSIVEFADCNGNGSLFKSGILKAGGIAFDQSGNLYYVDQLTGIYKCNGPSSCSIFTPIVGSGGLVIPTNINFDNGTPPNLWVADAGGYIDAVNVSGLIVFTLKVIGGIIDPPIGIAPAPGS